MAYTPYKLLVFIPPLSSVTLEEVVEKLRTKFASQKVSIARSGEKVVIKRESWSLNVYWEDEPHVLEEAQEIADHFANHRPDKDVIASSQRRLTTAGDPDPNMDYFNDYVWMIEAFEAIPEFIIFDANNGKFMDEM